MNQNLDTNHKCINKEFNKNIFVSDWGNSESVESSKTRPQCIRCYKRESWIELSLEVLELFIYNLLQEDLLYFSYPFIKDEKLKVDPFFYLTQEVLRQNAVQRNGGALRIILNSLLLLINARLDQEKFNSAKPMDACKDADNKEWAGYQEESPHFLEKDQLLKLLNMFVFGYPSPQACLPLFSMIYKDVSIKESKITINSIFNIDPKFKVEDSCSAKMRVFDKWNPHKSKSTILIRSQAETSEDKICLLQNTDFLVFYIVHSLVHSLLNHGQEATRYSLEVCSTLHQIVTH